MVVIFFSSAVAWLALTQLVPVSSQLNTQHVSALSLARNLEAPKASSTTGGEMEDWEFWDQHEALLQAAWQEWDSLNSRELPSLPERQIMNVSLHEQIHRLWSDGPTAEQERALQAYWKERIPGVWVCPQFLSPGGIRRIRQHLQVISDAGIPTRRPNAMNRYGLVLDHETAGGVSYPTLDSFRNWLVDTYMRPLARLFFSDHVGRRGEDDESSYMFTIHYEPTNRTGDVHLPEHADASLFTMNINLNLPNEGDYAGSSLEFNNQTRTSLRMEAGMAVLHRGFHRHRALNIETGRRDQLVIWLFGKDGYVRVAPYPPQERMTRQERWTRPTAGSRQTKVCAHDLCEL